MISRPENFRKEEHLLKSKDFNKVYKKGFSRKFGGVVLCCLPNMRQKSRLGFSISSKNIRLATRRNRIRRLFREVYRKIKDDLKPGFDIILVVKRDSGREFGFKEAKERFLRLAKETGVFPRPE